ncbi:hypothetical protein [Shinella zoogloeoides]|uniref:hypothetical protein n=1 Tax=Shinella zoogloeoides TaxID=352475 RepID=UPI0028A7539B|nr:hypothetical protein [Shinella zoogloeoides]
MARPYFTLAVREDGRWFPEFGAYDREDVVSEMDDYHYHGTKRKDMKVLKLADARTKTMEAAIAALNGKPCA